MLSVAAPIRLTDTNSIDEYFEPFSIDSLGTYSPSGRPGQPCKPSIQFTVVDPNSAMPQRSNCSKTWSCNDTDVSSQFQHVPCDDPDFWFNITIPDGGSPTENFVLRVHHVKEESAAGVQGNTVNVTHSGETAVKFPDQLSGECGASGACFWGLKPNEKLKLQIDDVRLG